MTDPLARLRRAQLTRSSAEEAFRSALLAAGETHGPTAIANALRWQRPDGSPDRQRVRTQLERWKETRA